MDLLNNRNKLLMLMSAVLMALAITLIIFNLTGVMEYSKHSTITFLNAICSSCILFYQKPETTMKHIKIMAGNVSAVAELSNGKTSDAIWDYVTY